MFTWLAKLANDYAWPIVVFWILTAIIVIGNAPPLEKVTESQAESFLPESAPSSRAQTIVSEQFTQIGESSSIVTFENPGGFTHQDLSFIRSLDKWIEDNKDELDVSETVSGISLPDLVSEDREAMLMLVGFADDDEDPLVQEAIVKIDDYLRTRDKPQELTVVITGGPAIGKDTNEAFENARTRSERLTVILVFIILMLIYRALLAMTIPLLVIGLSIGITNGVVALLADNFGLKVSDVTPMFIVLVLLGAGTNYCLFLISRYREELGQDREIEEAVLVTLHSSGEAIASSAGTVIIGFAGMAIAKLAIFTTMGPAVAIGIAITLVAALTLLPALMVIFKKAFFWPTGFKPKAGSSGRGRFWAGVGRQVTRRPVALLVLSALFLAPLGFYQTRLQYATNIREAFLPPESESLRAIDIIDEHFGKGEASKISIVISGEDLSHARSLSAIARFAWEIEELEDVEEVVGISDLPPDLASLDQVPDSFSADVLLQAGGFDIERFAQFIREAQEQFLSEDNRVARLEVTPAIDPFSEATSELVIDIRQRAETLETTSLRGASIFVGGEAAGSLDLLDVVKADFPVVAGVVLVGILIVLILLLRSLISPIYLLATVLITYSASLGASVIFFQYILGTEGLTFMMPIFTFIIIVALGEDFNIFLMSRLREEISKRGHLPGIAKSVAATGGVISSAGLIMAGALGSLTFTSMEAMVQMGFPIVFGILLDTFLVRPVIVPSIAALIGRWNWWPWSEPEESLAYGAAKRVG